MQKIINKELLSKSDQDFLSKSDEIQQVLTDVELLVETCESFEGNCFYLNKTFIRSNDLINKQKNLYLFGYLNPINICEIGFNAGHSAYLLLLGNKSNNINVTFFDINNHSYTDCCFEYICLKFPRVFFDFVQGNSIDSIPKWLIQTGKYEHFDLIHVDGGHDITTITNDFSNSLKMLKKGGIIIIDDIHKDHINHLVDSYLSTGVLEECQDIHETTVYPHRILKRIV
jgi:hypothetical protein